MNLKAPGKLAVFLLCACAAMLASARGYEVIDLGTLGGDASAALDINNAGHVVGWSTTSSGARHAFLYRRGTMTDLGTLPGGTSSEATGINHFGQVTGVSEINEYGPQFRPIRQAFVWEGGVMRSLGALYCPCTFNTRYGTSAAHGINDFGQIVGWSETVRGSWVHHAFVWQSGAMHDIGGGAGDWSISRAFAVNDVGDIVGDFAQDAGRLATYDRRAALWSAGARRDLGTLAAHPSSTAMAINRRGRVVGWSGSFDGSIARPFLWDKGVMRDLGTLSGHTSGRALGINDAGAVVGWSGTSDRAVSRAFLWWNGVMFDLNRLLSANSGWQLTEATAINNCVEIAGTGVHHGQVRAFLLTSSWRQKDDDDAGEADDTERCR